MIKTFEQSDAHIWTAAELAQRFGAIPLNRVLTTPPPGLATEADVIALEESENRLCELIDGVLLEKVMGYYESFLAVSLVRMIAAFVEAHQLGVVAGEGGMLRFKLGLIYIPDISFISWDRLGTRDLRAEAVLPVVPDLAVEVISRGNSADEMDDKLDGYFDKGVRLVWYVYPAKQEVHVFKSRHGDAIVLGTGDELDGSDVLPGFRVSLARLFDVPRNPKES